MLFQSVLVLNSEFFRSVIFEILTIDENSNSDIQVMTMFVIKMNPELSHTL